MASTTPTLDHALVFYPFADRLVPKDTAFTAGVTLPCSGAKVQRKPLATTLVAVAMWQLRESGLARLEIFEKKRFLGKQRRVGLARTASGAIPDGFAGSIARSIIDGGLDKNTVEAVVNRWLAEDSDSPQDVVIGKVVEALEAAGYFAAMGSARSSIMDQLRAGTGREPDCARFAALRPAFDEVVGGWLAFVAGESELHAMVVKDVERGIKSRQETEAGEGGDFDPD